MLNVKGLFSSIGLVVFLATAEPCETLTPEQAIHHIGEQATVEGIVVQVSVSNKGTVFLNFGDHFPDQVFYAVIFADDVHRFPAVQELEGRNVAISGRVELYRGSPEIILASPNQIEMP